MESKGLIDTLGDQDASRGEPLCSTVNDLLTHACRLYSHAPGASPLPERRV
jgi:hypothetical protein